MTRLPTPGSDDGTWGQLLNAFLSVEHNPDGTLKQTGSLATKADDATVVHNSGAETITGTKTFSASPLVPTPTQNGHATTKAYVDGAVAAGAPDATTSNKGIVQLAGDLGGTASTPTVAKISGVTISGTAANGMALVATSSSAASWSMVVDSTAVHQGDLVFNVKNYGAKGDGTTDDTTAIQNAINASTFGSVVFFPSGTYIVSSTISLLKQRRYIGSHRGSATIKQANGANLDAVLASQTWLSTASPAETQGDNPVFIEHLGVNGNSANQTSGMGIGIVLITFWTSLDHLEIQNTLGDGLRLTDTRRDGTELSITAVEIRISHIDVRSAGAYGIHAHDPTASSTQRVTDGWIRDCIIQGSTLDGIRIDSASGWSIEGNHIYGALCSGIHINRCDSARIIGNYVETWGSSSSPGIYAAIMVGDGSSTFVGSPHPVIVSQNTLFFTGGNVGGTVIYGINEATSSSIASNVVITGNGLYGNGFNKGIHIANQSSSATTNARLSGNVISNWATRFGTNGIGAFNIIGDIYNSSVAGSATDGFLQFPAIAGTPSGTPSDTTTGIPAVLNSSTNTLYLYNSGTWTPLSVAVVNSTVSSVQPAHLQSGEFLVPPNSGTNTVAVSTLNQMYLMPVDVPSSTTFSGIGSNISVVGAGSGLAVRLGYYADDGTGTRPAGAALLDAGTFDPTSGTGDRIITFSSNQTLSPGRYWLALVLQGTSITTNPTFVQLQLISQIGFTGLSNFNHKLWAMSSVSSALPTIGTLTRVGTNPIIGLKVA